MTAVRQNHEWAIKVEADSSRLVEIRRFVEEVATELTLDVERVFDLKVAVSEACANAMEHAGCAAVPLKVSARVQARRLTFVITDNGIFRPPTACRDSATFRGLGLPLMVTLMDEVSFCRAPDGGTQVSLSIELDQPPAVSD
jgi:anti-sigma regulatory factor (Ser/Thr protein kinase)